MISDPGSAPRHRRPAGYPALRASCGALAGVLLLVLLTACSAAGADGADAPSGAAGSSGGTAASGRAGASGSPGAGGSAGAPGSPGAPGAPGASASAAATAPAGSSSVTRVSCSGTSCSVTLAGNGSRAIVLGTAISLLGVRDGRAALRVGEEDVTCVPGQRVPSGPLDLECRAVGGDGVDLTATLR